MTSRHRRVFGACIVALLTTGLVRAQSPDPALQQAKTLYESASFEEALVALGRVDASRALDPDVLLYRALCLLALGRAQESSDTTRALVSASPTFSPDISGLPPRFQTLWTETRKTALPQLARELFAGARTRYQNKQFTPALEEFRRVISLTNDPLWKDSADAIDLRTLASGFADLSSESMPKPEPPRPAPPVTVAPEPVASPAPAPVPAVLVPAIPIRQTLPRWSPPDRTLARLSFSGAIRVSIDATGRVTDAMIVRPTHISYDTLLLRAAREWTYRPATRNGDPVASERIVDVRLSGTN